MTVMNISLHPRQSKHNLLCLLLMSGIHSQRDALFYVFKFYRQVFKLGKPVEENGEIDSSALVLW